MNLVAVDHRIIVLVCWHKRDEPLGLAITFDQEILEIQELHLFALRTSIPTTFGLFIIIDAGQLDEPEARLELGLRERLGFL